MSEFLYDASFFIAAAAAIAIAWQALTSNREPPSERTGDLVDPYDDDENGWGDDGDGDDD